MKFKTSYLILIMLALLITACSSSTPEAAPTAAPTNTTEPTVAAPTEAPTNTSAPTETPAISGDPVWDRVQAAGRIEFGTSADYPPFEYYDATDEIIGFDAALARELGSRLGLQVDLVDIAFEGLPAALQVGQVDAAIAAISVTPERQTQVDFTNVYYSGQDMILVREGSNIGSIVAAAQLAQHRVGVQRGSVYLTWVQKTLVDPGLMPQNNLFAYAKAGDAVRDLRENRVDLVVLDKLAAEEFILSGGVVAAGGNLNTQLFAIALPKSAPVLQAELNAALTALQNDGTIARLTQTYLDIELPTAPQAPPPAATAIPGPTPTPAACYDAMEFVSDVQVPDGTEVKAGQTFAKIWRVRNTGTCTWDSGYELVFVQGDRMSGGGDEVSNTVRPGDNFDLVVEMTAPNDPRRYRGFWQMVNENDTPFGERIWVKVTVPGRPQPTQAPPTETPVPPVQPTQAPAPTIEYLSISADTVQAGDLVIVGWSITGEGLAAARLTRTNPDGSQTPLYGGADVALQGEYEDLLMNPGQYTYTLNVSTEFGGAAVQTVVVNVQ